MPGSPVLRVVARFTASRRLARVRVTTALDALDEGGLGATAGRVLSKASWRDTRPLPTPGVLRWAQDERVDHVAVGAAGWPSGAKVLHLRPRDPAKVMSVTVESRRDAAAHWLITRHGMVDLRAGGTLVAEEDRLLGSGDVVAVAGAMARGAQGLDLDPASPSGAALHAVATALAFDATGAWRERLTDARRAELAGFATRHLARLEAGEAEGVDLGYVALAADALRRAGVVGAEVQARLVARLVARLDDAGVLRGPGAPSLAAQALATLAFARAACGPCSEDAAAALAAALGAVTAGGGALDFAGAKVEAAAEAEGVALLARAAGAAVLAAEASAPVPAQAVERGRQLHRIAVNLLRPMVQPRTGMLAVLGPAGMAPGLQALVTLALMAPERLVLGAPAPA